MDADLDTLATALYVRTDDLLKITPERAPWRPAVGIAPKISDAEVVTLAVMQALLGFTSEARWLRFATAHLRHLFPYLSHQPGYNKRLRRLAETIHDGPVQELIGLGCHSMQGFFFSAPLPPDEMGAMLRQPEKLAAAIAAIPRQRPAGTQQAATREP